MIALCVSFRVGFFEEWIVATLTEMYVIAVFFFVEMKFTIKYILGVYVYLTVLGIVIPYADFLILR
ncbi:MAG: hypothetical protein IJ168_02040 [Eubacterium sp.]|nr:hypothetical protein [Eubacterium sp.]